MPTYSPKAGDITRKWYVIDAKDEILGKVATHAAHLLRGKHKPTFAPHLDSGDYVIIINAEKVALTGKKLQNKYHYDHSGFPGGLKARSISKVLETKPERVVERAVLGMIPHGKLGRAVGAKLKVYSGDTHPHASQQPVTYEIKKVSQ